MRAIAPELFADLNPAAGAGSFPFIYGATDDRLFFSSNRGIGSTDGTQEGIVFASTPELLVNPSGFPIVARSQMFVPSFARIGVDLLVTKGPSETTKKLGNFETIQDATAIGDRLFFVATRFPPTSPLRHEVWVSDGTESGTHLLHAFPIRDQYWRFAELDGLVYFFGESFAQPPRFYRDDLWVTDGTAEGTRVAVENLYGAQLVSTGDALFFSSQDEFGEELWMSDGTPPGTRRVTDIGPGPTTSWPTYLTNLKDIIFFRASDTGTFEERDVWQFNVATGEVGRSSLPLGGIYPNFPVAGNGIYTYHQDPKQLWRTDGTPEGTLLVQPLEYGDWSSLTAFRGGVFFAERAPGETESSFNWTDGTPGPSTFIAHARYQGRMHVFKDSVYFVGIDAEHGEELWRLTPPPGDTNLDGLIDLADLNNVRNHFGDVGDPLGDANGDGQVDLTDLNLVRNHFGAVAPLPAPPAIATTPPDRAKELRGAAAADVLFTLAELGPPNFGRANAIIRKPGPFRGV